MEKAEIPVGIPIDKMKSLSKDKIEVLKENGIKTVEALLYRTDELEDLLPDLAEKPRDLMNIHIEALSLKKMWMVPASEISEVEKSQIAFTTGSKALDQLLGGGVHSMYVAEFYGEFGTGKSQILNTIMVEALNTFKDKTAVYIDCERTYRESRISEIASKRGYDSKDIISRIILIRTVTSAELEEVVRRLYLTVEGRNSILVVCDSLISHLRSEYLGREMLQPRQHALARILKKLKDLASLYNIGVVISNQVVSVPQQTFTPFGDIRPVGGHILGHVTEPRVFVRKAGAITRIARLEDSCWLPPGEATFAITEKGVVDVEEVKGVS
ncbi:MAG: DNA repair and recombination protein RadA [Candidatus Bathyarchaeia archaeon]